MFLTGKDIKAIREAMGIGQRQLGELLGMTEACVSLWEADKRRPRYDVLAEKHSPK